MADLIEELKTVAQMATASGKRILWIETSNPNFCDLLLGKPQGSTWANRNPNAENYWSISDSQDSCYILSNATIQFLIASDLNPLQGQTTDSTMIRQILILQNLITPEAIHLDCHVDRLSW